MDVQDLYEEIGRLINDPNHERFSEASLLARINIAQNKVVALTNAPKITETLTPVAGTATVSLDADVMDVVRVNIKNADGEWKPLDGILRDQLDFELPNWQQLENGEPKRWTWDGSAQQLILVGPPDSNWAVSNGLKVWEIQNPTDLDESADVPFAGNAAMVPYHMALAYWVAAQCKLSEQTPESLMLSKALRSDDFSRPGKFEKEIQMIRSKFDSPESMPTRILWRPQGGRASKWGYRSKGNPLGA